MKKLLIFTALVCSLCSLFYYFMIYPIPERSGELSLPILEEAVEVSYDKNGIPYIDAQNELDAFKSIGYVIAQHRLFQLDLQRRVATGRLSEVLGEKLLSVDKLNRSLGFRYFASEAVKEKKWSKKTNQRMDAFLEGINYFVDNGVLPIEFKFLKYKPEAFSKTDIIAFIGYMSFSFQEAFKQDPYLLDLASKLSPDLYEDLKYSYENDGPSIDKTSYKALAKTNTIEKNKLSISSQLQSALELNKTWGFEFSGSNAWLSSPVKSSSGHVLIANDPHIRHSNPGVWFEASLQYPGKQFFGHFLSFVPFPILGWSQNLAWTVTMSELDDMDFFLLSKKDGKYKGLKGLELNTQKISEDILVKDGGVVEHSFVSTDYGIVLDDFVSLNDETAITGMWSFYDKDSQAVEGLSQMFDATDIESFRSAVSLFTAPGLSVGYGDSKGNIAWFTLGRTYERPLGHTGTELRYAYNEAPPQLIPFKQNPYLINPSDQFIVTANHRLSNAEILKFPGYYQPSDRARRINDLMRSKDKFSAQDYINFFLDSKDAFFPVVKEDFIRSINLGAPLLDTKARNEIAADHVAGYKNNSAITFYRVWSRILGKEIFADEMGDENYAKLFKTPVRHNLYKKILSRDSKLWWDNINTEKVESKDDILKLAAQKTFSFLEKKLGPNQENWTWGKLHTLELRHALGSVKPLDKLFNLTAMPASGGYSMVDAQSSRDKWDNFDVMAGPSTKRLIDFAHSTWSMSILPSGNSGHRFDKFHNNQRNDYMRGMLQIRMLSAEYLAVQDIDSKISFKPNK